MKKLFFLLLVIPALTFNSCKKNSPSPSIIGTWKIYNITGTYAYQSSPSAKLTTTNYFYISPVLTESDSANSTLITITNESWVFNADGTFTIYENYQPNTTTTPTINTITGWWDYTSSTIPNSDLLLRSITTPSILPMGGTFIIKSVSNAQLILTVDESSVLSTGATTKRNFTLTFSRQ